MDAPGELIARGRDADIFDYGNDAVLRRSRNGRSQAIEARTMTLVRSMGYPVPEVFDVSDDGVDLVMEKIGGPTMVDEAASQPWKLRSFGRELAELHQALHHLTAPEWLSSAPCGEGDRLLHMDLHPLNIILSKRGPVVIDWTNAARGDPMVDVAATWVLLACANAPGGPVNAMIARFGRGILLNAFLGEFAKSELSSVLPGVVEWKTRDPNMSDVERRRMRTLR